MALAFATCVGVACADDPASSPGGSGGSAGKGGSSNAGGTAGSANTGGTAGKGGTGGKGGTAGTTGGTNSDGGTNSAGGTGGDAGAPGAGGMPDGAGGMPDGAGGMPDGAGGMPDGSGGAPDPGGEGGNAGEGPVDPPLPINLLTGTPDPFGFEANTTGWFTFGGPTNVWSSTFAHSGTRSYGSTKRKNSYDSPAANITTKVEQGKTYQFKAWVGYDPAQAGLQNIVMKIKVVGCGGDIYADLASGGTTSAGGTWFEMVGTYKLPATCTTATEIDLWWQGATTASTDPVVPATDPVTYYLTSFYVDDVSMFDVTPPPAP